MRFGPVPLDEAEGAVLAHSMTVGRLRFKKGRILSADDVAALREAGTTEVVAARLEDGDIAEDAAATAIATACQGVGVRLQAAFTGRCNLYAEQSGLLAFDAERVDAINLLHEAVTIATLEANVPVEAGQMLATVKVIPFAAPGDAVTRAVGIAGDGGPLLRVAAFRPRKMGLVMTRLPETKDKVLDKTVRVLNERLAAYGSRIAVEARCEHRAEAVAEAVRAQLAEGCDPVLVFGASAITDRRDEVPAGIVRAGGEVEHFGMPVDPGNLLLLARLGDVPVIGLPGCARSPKLNGFDWVLQRILADVPVGPRDIMRMGVGGLLAEIPSRPQPRAKEETKGPRAPRIVALVLAAGQSRRMGAANKLLAEVDGTPMVAHVVSAALASQCGETVVVTGHEADRVKAALAGDNVAFVHNPDYAEGLSTSLKAGLAALPEDADGVVVLLGDMPRLAPAHIDRLIAAFSPVEGRAICVPTWKGKRGNPVLFATALVPEMTAVAGDVGARHLIGAHADAVAEVPMPDDAVLTDIDTPEALARLRASGD